ncbi:hypothetical protein K3495_g15922, partial [Podosphaera aphanis]
FIENFAEISAPLQQLTKRGSPFHWTKERQRAFDKLKSLFITAPILAMWDGDKHTILETDASGWATGGCLSQYKLGGKLKPIAYYSKKLAPAECNYDIHDKELLSIIRCLQEWRSELIGLKEPFLILSDHKNLRYFMSTRKLSERQVRWSQLLSQFNFRLKFRSGKEAGRPDALSRRPQDMPKDEDDPRLKEREFQLLRKDWMDKSESQKTTKTTIIPGITATNIISEQESLQEIAPSSNESSRDDKSIPVGSQVFEDEEIQSLWDMGVNADKVNFNLLYESMWNKKPQFPSELQLKGVTTLQLYWQGLSIGRE